VYRFGLRHALRGRAHETAPPPPRARSTVAVVCAMDSLTHEVFDQDLAGVTTGRYRALCGVTIAAAPMSEPEVERCGACAATPKPMPERRVARPRLVRRLA